ncbi:hypothetical protein BCR42DRAFT_444363 [Absidia repens]|uniref:Enoyl-CoA hydratase n=1 Tax=Absidia repens TaxID=90262 RepID=A0A1X2HBD2_9FUNG|nr:hypothetical protein BCR42DRAFT_444798 [Absidia repens]ORZ04152.1 hypothetical protein BCR42DRAFT_444363 [Absidia repens]
MTKYQYETVTVTIIDKVAHVQMNRPKKLNSFNPALIRDVRYSIPRSGRRQRHWCHRGFRLRTYVYRWFGL